MLMLFLFTVKHLMTPDQQQTLVAPITLLDSFDNFEKTDQALCFFGYFSLCVFIGLLLHWWEYIREINLLIDKLFVTLSVISVMQINSTNLCKVVKDVDTVFIPAENPAISEETLEQAQLSVGWTVRPSWTGMWKQLKMRNLIP